MNIGVRLPPVAISWFDRQNRKSELTRLSHATLVLSYHSPDEPLAERKAAIERKDDGAIVFVAPADFEREPGGRLVAA
jgi:hypothetical protein